jgi:hypothetical protein
MRAVEGSICAPRWRRDATRPLGHPGNKHATSPDESSRDAGHDRGEVKVTLLRLARLGVRHRESTGDSSWNRSTRRSKTL